MPIDPTPGSGNEAFDHFVLALVESCVEEQVDALTLLSIVFKTITRTQGEAVAQQWMGKLMAIYPTTPEELAAARARLGIEP